MPTLSAPPSVAHLHPPLTEVAALAVAPPRPTLIDRAVHRVAVRLLLWSARRQASADYDAHTRAHECDRARRAREHRHLTIDLWHIAPR